MMSYEGSIYGNLLVIASFDGDSCRYTSGALKLVHNENPKKTRLQTLELLVKKTQVE